MQGVFFPFIRSLLDTTKLGIKQQSYSEILDMRYERGSRTEHINLARVSSTYRMWKIASVYDTVLETSRGPSFIHIDNVLACTSQPPGLERRTIAAQARHMISTPN